MIDFFLHLLGICGDNHGHFDLTDILAYISGESSVITNIKYYLRSTWDFIVK